MGVLYVRFESKERPRIFGCVPVGSAMLFILWYRLLLYSAVSVANRVQVDLSGFSMRLLKFCPGQNFLEGMVVCISWLCV